MVCQSKVSVLLNREGWKVGKDLVYRLHKWQEYYQRRPHRALAYRTPAEFGSQIAINRDLAETKTSPELTL